MLKVSISLVILVVLPLQVLGHGMVMDPVNRASRWRVDPTATPDYTDNGLYCGGYAVQWTQNNGKCGMCGNSYSAPRPRDHELGGMFGQGVVVKTYKAGSVIPVQVRITANHRGFFEFNICNLDKFTAESDECFSDVQVQMANGELIHSISTAVGEHMMNLKLPEGLVCEHCVLQWTYTTANRWGVCEDGKQANGCGPQEQFRTCSDISIEA